MEYSYNNNALLRKTEIGDSDLEAMIEYLTRPRSEDEEPPDR